MVAPAGRIQYLQHARRAHARRSAWCEARRDERGNRKISRRARSCGKDRRRAVVLGHRGLRSHAGLARSALQGIPRTENLHIRCDRRKRPVMGEVASRHCEEIVLTDDDAYDEDPALIAEHIKRGIPKNLWHKVSIEPDRRKAIAFGLSLARRGDTVLITGKGTDPYLMGPRGRKLPWNDAAIAEEELRALLSA